MDTYVWGCVEILPKLLKKIELFWEVENEGNF